MKNPLYPLNIVDTTQYDNYSRCLVITLENTHNSNIFEKNIDNIQTYYKEIQENYKVTSIPMYMIKSIPTVSDFIIFEVSEDDLIPFNFNGKTLKDELIVYNLNEAILLIPNHPYEWFYPNIEIFVKDGINDMYNFLKNINMNTLLSDSPGALLETQLLFNKTNIDTSRDVIYWKDINKCQINITTHWLQRDIKFSDAKEMNVNLQNELTTTCNNYLQNVMHKNSYVDASSGIITHKYKLYYIEEHSDLPIDNIISHMLYLNKDHSLVDFLINKCLISKKYTHRILKNYNVLSYIQNNISKFQKAFSYAWVMMYLEEGILKSMIKEDDRCVFTLEEANKLPITDSCKNMYIPLMVEKNFIHMFGGYSSNSNIPIQLSNMSDFKKRLQIFITYHNIDIFKNLNWDNLAISGSVIAAACRKIDPLERDAGLSTSNFFDTYYENSDIDIMCNIPDYKSFIDKIEYLISVITSNILAEFPSHENPVQSKVVKTVALHLTKKYIDANYNGKITDNQAYEIYCELKKKDEVQEEKYKIINEIVSFDNFKYYVYNNPLDDIKNPTYSENIKYNISSPYMRRNLEIFKIKYTFLATVSRFHLPCVRGYYDGSTVYLLPSAISALLSNKCIDYKYFAGVRSPFEIILKYVFRGYSIILNKKEMIKLAEYIKNSDKWKNIFKYTNSFTIKTYQSYYNNPFVLLNKPNIDYYNYRKYYEANIISNIVSSLGYIIPYS